MIVPTKLHIKNFGLIKDSTVTFDSCGFYYITGECLDNTLGLSSNGSGKSSILNALWMALTGEVVQNVALIEVVGPYSTVLELDLTLMGNGHLYQIKRKRWGHHYEIDFLKDGK